ncbi:MAG: hypothetical protein M3421_15425 [Bacteroidota bacterium]|nr:hypothetical protein [Bacteroidota bacterium]
MNALHITRLGLFMKRQLTINIHSLWIALGALIGILLLISISVAYFNPQNLGGLQEVYITVFYLAGFMFTSKIFYELHSPNRSFAFLTLPVSNIEKLIGAWLITAPLFALVYLLFIFILTSISSLIAGHSSALEIIFNRETLESIGLYLVLHSIFFLGACTFKGNNFLKTLLWIFLFMMAVLIFAGLLFLLLFGTTSLHIENVSPEFQYFMTDVFTKVLSFLFWYVLAPFMLVVSYFKLKERQV